jgi:3-oxoacyl-[acyl-carrier-protein] synthase II
MEMPMNAKRRVVITGIGVVNPAGIGLEAFWKTVSPGISSIRKITRFDPQGFPVQIAGEIVDFRPQDFIPRRFVVKTDRFTHYTFAATEMALHDARLDLAQQDPYHIGIFFGNNAGGWDINERGYYELYQQGAPMVNPWQATAWFPTAPQGYVGIRYGIKGYSKSFVCDRVSGACALYFGIHSILQGHNDIVLTGGTEAPITRFGMTCYIETGELAPFKEPEGAYRPFDRDRSGIVLAEGSTVLILEELEHARQRGAYIYGELLGYAMTTDPDPSAHGGLVRAMRKAMQVAQVTPSEVDLILAEGCGTQLSDRVEAHAITEVFSAITPEVPVTSPKATYGHLFGASGATEMVSGLLAMKTGIVPPTINFTTPDSDCCLRIVSRQEHRDVSCVLLNARSKDGVNICLLVATQQE